MDTAVADAAAKLTDDLGVTDESNAALLHPHPTLTPGSLLQYILLPVDQYVLLDDSMVTRCVCKRIVCTLRQQPQAR